MHWGDVNSSKISDNQTEIADFLVKQGVDMIVINSLKCLTPSKEFKDKMNFILAENLDEVFAVAFDKSAKPGKKANSPKSGKKAKGPAAASAA